MLNFFKYFIKPVLFVVCCIIICMLYFKGSKEIKADEHEMTALQEFIDQVILPSIVKVIGSLDAAEFDDLQESLLTFLLEDWKESCCFVTISLVADIFGYISQ